MFVLTGSCMPCDVSEGLLGEIRMVFNAVRAIIFIGWTLSFFRRDSVDAFIKWSTKSLLFGRYVIPSEFCHGGILVYFFIINNGIFAFRTAWRFFFLDNVFRLICRYLLVGVESCH